MPEHRQLSISEAYCEEYFKNTTTRKVSGRFIVRLPRKKGIVLGDSKQQAIRRFYALERRLKRQSSIKDEYVQFMREYEQKGHMSLVMPSSIVKEKAYFIPHQPVLRPESITTKLRVVFDASAKTDNNNSLNNMLMAGPNLQGDLLHILLRFRNYEFVLTGDIAMMFCQILIAEEDRNLQHILWREKEEHPLKTFALNTVTYGTKSAPYLVMRCLKQLVIKEGEQFPMAQQALRSDFIWTTS
ncbi:PREDICTED: uncharacterized protein LOC105448095 [Wasmannia auropunctata]|uniref:uncharacterized protein LOC105448095 n=1 Tax=Wasmannia auropunctata TaxID=64793 RepID=UPI0005EE1061|nr:PREDICTED: uncharacterized protein LOC105448095 [Wasmannia auropunctata]